jgi:membrane protein implicated in regulation of membrane protease activity
VSVFLASLLQYAVKFVLFAAVALAGIFLGKALRGRKDAKAGQIKEEN